MGAHLVGGGNSNIFGIFTPKIGEDEPHLTSIFFGWNQPPTKSPFRNSSFFGFIFFFRGVSEIVDGSIFTQNSSNKWSRAYCPCYHFCVAVLNFPPLFAEPKINPSTRDVDGRWPCRLHVLQDGTCSLWRSSFDPASLASKETIRGP